MSVASQPALSLMDCLKAFVDGGPDPETRTAPRVFLASDDRCVLDAAATALLRFSGMQGPAAQGPIRWKHQLARAIR